MKKLKTFSSRVDAFHPVSPELPRYHKVALWCVYGPRYEPRMICCQIHTGLFGEPNIWSYVPRTRTNSGKLRQSGFHYLGMPLGMFRDTEENTFFFTNQQAALGYMAWLTQPEEKYFTAALRGGEPWANNPQSLENLMGDEPDEPVPAQLSELAQPPLNRDEKISNLLWSVKSPEEIYRIFYRVRARLIAIFNANGYRDSSIAGRVSIGGAGINRIREKLRIGPEFDTDNLQAQEKNFHRQQEENPE